MISKIFRTLALTAAGFAALSLLAAASLSAQAAPSLVTNRLTQPIDVNTRVTLRGTVHPFANAANDRGAAPDSMPLDRIQVVLKRSPAQESALQQLIHDQHTSGTASYHKWLTPAQFGQQFGPSDQDVATLEAWLESQGFNVTKLNSGKQILEMSGNVAQLRTAFHTQIHKYMVQGETHYANSTDPQIPAAIAPVFGGFASLNNFPLKSYVRKLGHAAYDTKTGQAKPEWTVPSPYPLGYDLVLSPQDYAIQYDLPPAITGAGQTIAIINETNINVALVNQFRTLFGLPANPPQVIIDGNDPGIDGINNPDGPNYASTEAYLDVEWSGAVAPAATVDLVIAADTSLESGLLLAAEHAVYGNIAPVISLSFGGCEQSLGSANALFSGLWEQAAAQGITVTVASGDSGSAGCDDPDSQYYAIDGLNVSGTSSTPYNVSVGGTDFYYSSFNQGTSAIQNQVATYWNTTPSATPAVSIKGVIPEQPWNDSQFGSNIYSFYDLFGITTIAGGGGGPSTCATGTVDTSTGTYSACTAGYPKPAWQTGAGVPSDKVRDVPDVSLFAADGSANGSYYPICADDGDCQPASGGSTVQILAVGGTSASAPSFAGIMALVNQKYGRQGQADYVLYPLASQFPAAFHDVTVGTNAEPCAYSSTASSNTPNCNSVSNPLTVTDPTYGEATEGELSGYSATAGYDTATGLGSVDASVLINDWGSVKFASTGVTLTSPTAGQSFTHGQSVSFTGSVAPSGSSSTPTGDVSILTDSTEPVQQGQTLFTLSNGSFSGSITTLPGGTYNVWANYAGDTKNAASASTKTQITVSPEASTTYFTVNNVATGYGAGPVIASGTTNIPYGTQLILSAQPYPTTYYNQCVNTSSPPATCSTLPTQPTGTVAFADNGTPINTAVLNAEGDAEYNAPWAIGSHSVTASYKGDNSYNASNAAAITFSIAKNTPEINLATAVTTQAGALAEGQQNVFTIQVLNSANINNESTYGAYSNQTTAPTGTVTISGFPSGVLTTATLAPGVDGTSYSAAGIATITIPASTPAGNYNVTVSYPGDTNYASQTTSATIPIQSVGGVATTTTASLSGSISPTTSVTLTGIVTGKSGDAAPSNAGGGILIYASGYVLQQISLVPGSGDTSTFSAVLNSQNLLQGTNPITVQYLGDNTYAPSATTLLTTPISSPLSDFSMVPNTTIVPVTEGTPATDAIQLASVNGFANSVSFTCTAAAGITCSLSPTSYGFTSGSSSTATLTLDASSSAVNGANNVLITGTDSTGKYVHTLSIDAEVTGATVPAAGFTLNVSPSALTLAPGSSTTSPGVSVTPSGGFTGAVALTADVTGPSGATSPPTVSFSPATLNVNGTSAISAGMSIATTSTTTEGNYTITVTGTASPVPGVSIVETATMTLTVSKAAFALSASPASLTLAPGATTGNTSTITVAPSGGFTGAVALTCSVTGPSGANDPATCALTPGSVSVSGTASVTATLTISTTAATSSALDHPLNKFFAASGGIVVAVLLFFGIPARRRNWRSMLVILIFAGIAGFGIGCGGGSGGGGGGGGGNAGTTPGAYTITVTGTSGSLAPTTTVTVTVN